MKKTSVAFFLSGAALIGLAGAQDVAVSKVAGGSDYDYYGESGGIAAFSMASTSCNVGNIEILWNDSIGQAPVIAQNMFRIHEGRIEQLGYSYLKDSFCAVSEPSCGNCISTPCNTLGIGCADTYWAGLNDGASGVPKYQVNPTTGVWPASWGSPVGALPLRGRLQAPSSDLADPGSIYVAEITYISEHDQMAGNARNNASWQQFQWTTTNLGSISNVGALNMFDPGIFAWPAYVPTAQVEEAPNLNEGGSGVHGYYFVGSNATSLGNGMYRYDYAVMNMNSDQAARAFTVNTGGATISNVSFRDVDYHSGSPWQNTDWSISQNGSSVTWETDTFASNSNANAIRWGMMYNFSFESDTAPGAGSATIEMFKPGVGSSINVNVQIPSGCGGGSITPYCSANGNSMSPNGANVVASGSTNLSDQNLSFSVTNMPSNQFGYFLTSQSQTFVMNFSGTQGNLCVGAPQFRFTQNVLNSGAFGFVDFDVPFNNLPNGVGFTPGSTWNFQLWYRDVNPTATSNTSAGIAVTFCQ